MNTILAILLSISMLGTTGTMNKNSEDLSSEMSKEKLWNSASEWQKETFKEVYPWAFDSYNSWQDAFHAYTFENDRFERVARKHEGNEEYRDDNTVKESKKVEKKEEINKYDKLWKSLSQDEKEFFMGEYYCANESEYAYAYWLSQNDWPLFYEKYILPFDDVGIGNSTENDYSQPAIISGTVYVECVVSPDWTYDRCLHDIYITVQNTGNQPINRARVYFIVDGIEYCSELNTTVVPGQSYRYYTRTMELTDSNPLIPGGGRIESIE